VFPRGKCITISFLATGLVELHVEHGKWKEAMALAVFCSFTHLHLFMEIDRVSLSTSHFWQQG